MRKIDHEAGCQPLSVIARNEIFACGDRGPEIAARDNMGSQRPEWAEIEIGNPSTNGLSELDRKIPGSVVLTLLLAAKPIRVWNGIFVAGDRRAKRDLMTMSPCRDRKTETPARWKWPQNGAFPPQAIELAPARFCNQPALFEFGTGFLPPETGAPKAPQRRYLRAETGNRRPPRARNSRKSGLRACKSLYLDFAGLGGGRTRARTSDPLIKGR
jgi:hypothetical protein